MWRPPSADDFLVLRGAVCLEVSVDAIPVASLDAIERVDHEEVDELVIVDELLFAARQLFGDAFVERLLASHVLGVAAEQDVGAAAGHVGRDGDGALAARLGDDFRFLRVIFRVEDDVLDALAPEHARQPFGLFDRDRADQHRPRSLPAWR